MTAQSARDLAKTIDADAITMPDVILADWLQERGHEDAAHSLRRADEATRLVARLTADGLVTAAECWTLDRAVAEKGPAARTCEKLLRAGKVLVVIYTDDSLTDCGLLARKTADKNAPVIHYRKSSGGRWGRSVAQTKIAI
jgi:protoporphyrinogen oxidase